MKIDVTKLRSWVKPYSKGSPVIYFGDSGPCAESVAVMSSTIFARSSMTGKQVREGYIDSPGGFVFLAKVERCIGYVGYLLAKVFPDSVVIRQVGVEPEHRRRGVGRSLMNVAVEVADQIDVPVVARIKETDKDSLAFFLGCHFFGSSVLRSTVPGGRDEYLMSSRKPIPKPVEAADASLRP